MVDEPMAPQVNIQAPVDLLSNNWKDHSVIKLGAFYFYVKHDVMKGPLGTAAVMPGKFTIVGTHLCNKLQNSECGSRQVNINKM